MKRIINEKIYDTEKAEKVLSFGIVEDENEMVLYKTKNGNFFMYMKEELEENIFDLNKEKAVELYNEVVLKTDYYIKNAKLEEDRKEVKERINFHMSPEEAFDLEEA